MSSIKCIAFIIVFSIVMLSCYKDKEINGTKDEYLFENVIDSSGITFKHQALQTEDFNILEYLYFYNGGGVSIGDVNNDGLEDLFFSGSQSSDRLYINKGNFRFEDQTLSSGIDTTSGWSTGCNIVDINGDGWQDIFVGRLGQYKKYQGDYNRVYINDGKGKFVERSSELGLRCTSFTTQASFFDIDNDGDLDAYILNHSVKDPSHFTKSEIRYGYDSLSGDRLYLNDKGVFKDISESSGILRSSIGFGLGISHGDFNNDGWQDIYICNDFHENDYLYLNQKGGKFKEVCAKSTGHTSQFSMGVDYADLDEDGLLDLMTVDMRPEDEIHYKNSGGWESIQIYNFKRSYGYHHQLPKNALQWCRGIDNDGIPYYSEIGGAAGVDATDWSWSPLMADWDGDGRRDIFVSNGIYKRPNDMDFVLFFSDGSQVGKTDQELINLMPRGDVVNVFYKNEGNFKFSKKDWVKELPNCSNGAAYGDLDNDGDMDLVVNQYNDKPLLYKNKSKQAQGIKIILQSRDKNTQQIGAKVVVYSGKNTQSFEVKSTCGFQSSSSRCIKFNIDKIDSIKVAWPNGYEQSYVDLSTKNETIILTQDISKSRKIVSKSYFGKIKDGNSYHLENEYNDQQTSPWIPYLLSTMGARMAMTQNHGLMLTQSLGQDISFDNKRLINKGTGRAVGDENNLAVFDANSDGIDDIYLCLGGNQAKKDNEFVADQLWLQTKDKKYIRATYLPKIAKQSSCAAPCDVDNDGDMDIFVGVYTSPYEYGSSDTSYLLINNKNKSYTFQPLLFDKMVFDAVWSDMDNNGTPDLVVCGHWMPITIYYNNGQGKFNSYEIANSEGLWFDILIDDIDGDGHQDILSGNFGINHKLKATVEFPLQSSILDIDGNSLKESMISYPYFGKYYPMVNKDMFVSLVPKQKKRFLYNKDFSSRTTDQLLSHNSVESKVVKNKFVKTLESKVFYGKGGRVFRELSLPFEWQISPIWAIEKIDKGQYMIGGNFFGVDPIIGRQDALFAGMIKFQGQSITTFNRKLYLPFVEVRDILDTERKVYLSGINSSVKIINK